MLFILDAPALVGIEEAVADPAAVFVSLTDLVKNGELCYCDEVVKYLERLWKDSVAHLFAKAAQAFLEADFMRGGAYGDYRWVLRQVPEIVDVDAANENDAAAVLAHGHLLTTLNIEFMLATGDVSPKPTRISTHMAAGRLGIPVMTTAEFMAQIGIS